MAQRDVGGALLPLPLQPHLPLAHRPSRPAVQDHNIAEARLLELHAPEQLAEHGAGVGEGTVERPPLHHDPSLVFQRRGPHGPLPPHCPPQLDSCLGCDADALEVGGGWVARVRHGGWCRCGKAQEGQQRHQGAPQRLQQQKANEQLQLQETRR